MMSGGKKFLQLQSQLELPYAGGSAAVAAAKLSIQVTFPPGPGPGRHCAPGPGPAAPGPGRGFRRQGRAAGRATAGRVLGLGWPIHWHVSSDSAFIIGKADTARGTIRAAKFSSNVTRQ
jgi:hypothetical protein